MKVVLSPGDPLIVQFKGSEKLLLVETDYRQAVVYTADPHPSEAPPERIYDRRFTIDLMPKLI